VGSDDSDHVAAVTPAGGLFSAAALEHLYRTHTARLVRHLARRVGRDDAGDIVNEAFTKLACAGPDARRAIESPEAFVTTVATNVLRDRARLAARRAVQLEQLALDAGQSAADPHRLLEAREALRAVEQALQRMNPRRRRIFMLHRFEQMTYAEIGTEVGMSEKGVKKQMAKALFELRVAADRGL
jgi:RNA polymerase sigma-70 factor (ECF subfamily)